MSDASACVRYPRGRSAQPGRLCHNCRPGAVPLGRNPEELVRQIRAYQHVRLTGEVTPSGWQPGEPTLV